MLKFTKAFLFGFVGAATVYFAYSALGLVGLVGIWLVWWVVLKG